MLVKYNNLSTGTIRGTGLACPTAMNDSAHRRPKPKVPEPLEPIEEDPFEMDWPWPCNLQPQNEASPPTRPSLEDVEEEPAEEAAPVDGNGK